MSLSNVGINHNICCYLVRGKIIFRVTKDEYALILNNLKDVIALHEGILGGIETAITMPPNEQRVGKLFLTLAPKFSQVHSTYCTGHPQAVFTLNKFK